MSSSNPCRLVLQFFRLCTRRKKKGDKPCWEFLEFYYDGGEVFFRLEKNGRKEKHIKTLPSLSPPNPTSPATFHISVAFHSKRLCLTTGHHTKFKEPSITREKERTRENDVHIYIYIYMWASILEHSALQLNVLSFQSFLQREKRKSKRNLFLQHCK